MRAAERGGVVRIGQRADRAPALGAQLRGSLRVMAERQEQRVAARLVGLDRLDQLLGEERETRGDFVGAADAVGAATAERAAYALGIEREAEPSLVFEAVPFRGI